MEDALGCRKTFRKNFETLCFSPSTQDLRLWRVNTEKDSLQCDNEKLVSGSTSAFRRSARDFLKLTVFKDGEAWPTAIFAPSFVVHDDESPNTSIEVCIAMFAGENQS